MFAVNTDVEVFGKIAEFIDKCHREGWDAEIRLGLPGEFGDFCLAIHVYIDNEKEEKKVRKMFREHFGEDMYEDSAFFGYVRLAVQKKG